MDLSQISTEDLQALRANDLSRVSTEGLQAYKKLLAREQEQTPLPERPEPTPKQSAFRQLADIPLGVARGAASGVRMIADAFGAGSETAKTIKGVEDYLGGLLSAQAQNDQKKISQIMQEAEDKGVVDNLKAAVRAFSVAPVDMLSNALGTAAPAIVAGLGAKVLGPAAAIASGIGVGGTMGAGVTKGTIYEETKRAMLDAGTPPEQAEARAQLAQSYGGKNLDMILSGAALGGLAATTGVERAIIRPVAQNILKKSAAGTTQASVRPSILGTAAAEALPETAQGAQERLAQNIALQREGFDVPTMRGVVGAGALEGIVGGGLGAGVGALTGRELAPQPAPQAQPAPVVAPEAPPEAPIAPIPTAAQQPLFATERPATAPTLEGMTPSGQFMEAPRSVLGAESELATDEATAQLEMQQSELQRTKGILEREVARAPTAAGKVALQYQIKEIDSQLNQVQAQLRKLGVTEPTKRERADLTRMQPELDLTAPEPQPVAFPPAPEVPTPPAPEPFKITDQKLTELGFAKTSKRARTQLKEMGDLTSRVNLDAFEDLIEQYRAESERLKAAGKKDLTPRFNYEKTRAFIDQAKAVQKVEKTRSARPQLLGGEAMPDPTAMELMFAQQRRNEGMPLTDRQKFLLRDQPTPKIITPQETPAPQPLEVVTSPERKPGGQFLTPTDIPKPLQEPVAAVQPEEVQKRRRSKSMPTRQMGLDFEGAPDDTGRQIGRAGVVPPVSQPEAGVGPVGGVEPAGVAGTERDVGRPAEREAAEQRALEAPTIDKPTARSMLKEQGVPTPEINRIVKSYDEPTGFAAAEFKEAFDRGDFLKLKGPQVGAGLPEPVTAKLQTQDLKGALRTLSETGSTPVIRTVARKLLPAIRKTNIVNQATPDGSPAAYNRATDTIYLDPSVYSEHALLHEATHAAIAHVLDNKLNPLTQKLQKLFDALAQDIKNTYGATNLQEFAAEAMSNPEFQSLLRGQPKNWFGRFVDAIRGFLGLSKAKQVEKTLDQILDIAPTETAQPSTDILRLETAAPQTYEGKIKKIVADTPQPQAVASRAFDKVMSWLDAAYPAQEAMRKAMRTAGRTVNEIAVGLGLFAQAGHFGAVSARGLQKGGMKYDPAVGNFVATDSEYNMARLKQVMTDMGQRYGLSNAEVDTVVNNALEGKRLLSIYAERDSKLQQAERLAALGNKKAAKKLRDEWEEMPFHMSREEAKQKADLFKQYPELKQIEDIKNGMRGWVVKFLTDMGLISQEKGETWLDNAEWIPFQREFDPDETASMEQFAKHRMGIQATARNPKYKGSLRPVEPVLENFEKWIMHSLRMGMREGFTKAAVAEFIKSGQAKPDSTKGARGTESRRVKYHVDGQPRYALFDDPSIAAFYNSNVVPPKVSGLLSGFNALFRKSIIGLPTFAVKQLIVDSMEAIQKSGLPPRYAMRIPIEAAKEFMTLTFKGTTPTYEKLTDRGFAGPFTDLAAVQSEELKKLGYGVKDETQRNAFMRGLQAAELFGMRTAMHSDNAIRAALYKISQEAGMNQAQSYNLAADYINFRRQVNSDLLRMFVAYVPFSGAAMAAVRSSLMAISGKGLTPQERNQALRNYAANMALLTTISMLMAMANEEDEEYRNMSPEQRARQITIPGTGGVGIPRRVSIETLFPILAEMMTNQATSNAVDATQLKRVLVGLGMEALAPVPMPMPAPIKTAVEQATNYNFFTGEPIVGYGMSRQEAWKQYGASTSSVARSIGEALNEAGLGNTPFASPTRVDHVVRGLLGSLGSGMLMLSNMVASKVGDRPAMTANEILTSIPGFTMPAAREFNLAARNDFYDLAERMDKVASTANALLKEGRIEEYRDYVEKNATKIGMDKAINRIMPQLRKIRNAMRMVRESDMPDKDEKLQQLRQMEMNFIRSLNVPELRRMAGL